MRLRIAIVAYLLVACTGATASVEPTATASCETPELPPVQSGLHLVGEAQPPVPYSSTPPTSGWHRSGAARAGVAPEPLPEPVQVGLLEAGTVVVTHGELAAADRRALVAWTQERGDVALSAYDGLAAGSVAFTAWGVLQRCDAVDLEAAARFADHYGGEVAGHGAGGAQG